MSAYNRRDILRLLGSGLSLPWYLSYGCSKKSSNSTTDARPGLSLLGQDRKFIFVFTAMGGASINDSFMAVTQSESRKASTLNTFADRIVYRAEGTNLTAVDLEMDTVGPLPFKVKGNQSSFLAKYARDIMVCPVEGTTVAHPTGQYRSVTGDDAWNGRTLQEAVAAQYGDGLLIPNVNMATVGYADPGRDPNLPTFARHQTVANPNFFPFGMHGYKGIAGAPDAALIDIARQTRDQKLEPASPFLQGAAGHPLLQEWLRQKAKLPALESRDLINRLNPFEHTKDFPFEDYGLKPNNLGDTFRNLFPDLGADALQSQAMLAYLLVTQGLTCSVTFGLGMNVTVDGSDAEDPQLTNTPTGFDYSHNAHRGTQALLWNRTLDVIDRLITLLKATEYRNGESFWQHSLVYIATEFGRDKDREDGKVEFTSGHHTNNGLVVISPMVNGGRALGGIDKNTLLTYGFDPASGTPEPGRKTTEKEIYAGILQAMGVNTSGSGLPDMRAMRKKA